MFKKREEITPIIMTVAELNKAKDSIKVFSDEIKKVETHIRSDPATPTHTTGKYWPPEQLVTDMLYCVNIDVKMFMVFLHYLLEVNGEPQTLDEKYSYYAIKKILDKYLVIKKRRRSAGQ